MAQVNAIRTALGRLGFSNEAANYITSDQNGQGMNSLAEFAVLTDDEVKNLCKVVRRPGGMMQNPNAAAPPGADAAAAAAAAAQPAQIPNPGLAVTLRAENNLKLACYFLRYKERTSRAVTADMITLASVRELRPYREWEENHKDVEAPEINAKDWPRTIEAIEEYLRGCLGVQKTPLVYVIHDDIAVPAVDPAGGYPSRQDELIARAPIQDNANQFTAVYLDDRNRVWEKLSELMRDHECWSYVRPAQRNHDGRLAFSGLKGHYLGVNNVDNMSSKAEKKLQTTTYTGEKRRWNFEKYVRVHIDQHTILNGLKQHGYSGIDERSKVRHLTNGIKTKALDSVKTQILSSAALRNDFSACVNLFQDFIEQDANQEKKTVTIAAVRTSDDGDVQPDMSVEDRYYNRKEYAKLTSAQKLGLKAKRDKRGHKSKRKRGTSSDGKIDLSKKTIKALASAVMNKVRFEDGEDADSEPSGDEATSSKRQKKTTNRNNPALSRPNQE